MDTLLNRLESTLREQIEAHRALGGLIAEERVALVGLDIDVIHACARRKEELNRCLLEAEAGRRRTCDAIAERLGIEDRPLRLGALIERLPEWRRPALVHLREELLASLESASDGQGRNRTLAERFLAVLSGSMEAMQRSAASLPLYRPTAQVGEARWPGAVLSQTA